MAKFQWRLTASQILPRFPVAAQETEAIDESETTWTCIIRMIEFALDSFYVVKTNKLHLTPYIGILS